MTLASEVSGFADQLRQVLQDSQAKYSSTSEVVLQGNGARFCITGLPSPSVVVVADKVGHLGTLKDGRWKQICDYLLITTGDGHVDVTFIEMKETFRPAERKPKEQLLRTVPILKYLLSLCEIEFGSATKVVQRFAVLAPKKQERIDKQRTKIEPKQLRYKERHKGIDICVAIGGTISFDSLDV